MRQMVEIRWSGDIPGYGDVTPSGTWAISVPNEARVQRSDGQSVPLGQPANWIALSDLGQLAWQGHDDGLIRPGDIAGYGQHSFLWVGETLKSFTDVQTYWATSGWRYVDDAGAIVAFGLGYSGPPLWNWIETGGVRFGQGHEDGLWAGIGAAHRLLVPGQWNDLKVRRAGGTFYLLAVNYPEHRTCAWVTTLEEILALPTGNPDPQVVTPPAPLPPPLPPPPPTPEPVPVSIALPSAVKDTCNRFVAQFPVPSRRSDEAQDAFEERCRTAWVLPLAEQVRFEFNDPTWGCKNAGGGRPRSKDSIAHQDNGRLINFDLLSGVGTGFPSRVADPQGEDITGQTFMPVQPVNHLGGAPPVILPPPAPTDDPRIAQLQTVVDLLRADVQALKAVVDNQDARLRDLAASATPDLSEYVKHGALVTVSGKVELSLFGQRLSRTVVSTGTL